jgi:demethylmenaquinone methyltransferase / 2-methoxy-6-polyprenyl-1,4-benzoquinol methylase
MSEVGGRQPAKGQDVQRMFAAIARRYDFLNHFLSGNIDRRWRRACVLEVSRRLSSRQPEILDVGCGTGDLSLAFSALGPVIGCDFCHPMLQIGRSKVARSRSAHPIRLLEGDVLALPFPDARFDAVVSAFVLRNLSDALKGLQEMRRVLRCGGVLAVLDFSMPRMRVLGSLYRLYFLNILPRLGTLISGVEGPYKYLPDSVQSFRGPDELKTLIASTGFGDVDYRLFSGGIAVLMIARG